MLVGNMYNCMTGTDMSKQRNPLDVWGNYTDSKRRQRAAYKGLEHKMMTGKSLTQERREQREWTRKMKQIEKYASKTPSRANSSEPMGMLTQIVIAAVVIAFAAFIVYAVFIAPK